MPGCGHPRRERHCRATRADYLHAGMGEREDLWRELRALRAAPVGQAREDDDRREVFAAALRQSQEFADAADEAGYATKPLPLYYAFSQGVRAIAAAGLDDPAWRVRGHGAAVKPAEALLSTAIIPNAVVSADTRDAVTAVQQLDQGLPALVEPMDLGDLWCAMPQLPPLPNGLGAERPRSLRLHLPIYDELKERAAGEGRIELAVQGLSAAMTEDELAEALRSYPTLAGGESIRSRLPEEPPLSQMYNTAQSLPTWRSDALMLDVGYGRKWISEAPVLSWPIGSEGEEKRFGALAPVAIEGLTDQRLVFPTVGGACQPSFVALWLLLLLGLSSLVRYEPAMWIRAVDPNHSTLAVPLEQVCDRASLFVPQILASTFRRIPT